MSVVHTNSVTKSAGATLVSMLGAVNTTANTVTRAVHTTASALDMLDQYVQDARAEQIARSVVNRAQMLQRIHEETALEAAERQLEITRKVANNPDLKKLFEEQFHKFEQTINGDSENTVKTKLLQLDTRLTLG